MQNLPNMTRPSAILYIAFLFPALFSCSQDHGKISFKGYFVDNAVKQKVDPKVRSVNGVTLSTIDFKIYENDSLIADSYATGKSIDECMTMTSLQGDTILITGYVGMFGGFGYQIALFKDTCMVAHFAKSDAEIYKLKEKDSLDFGVTVPCRHYTLTLSEKP